MKRKAETHKKCKYMICLLLSCILCLVPATAAEAHDGDMPYVVTLYNEKNGLPTGEANTILQTSDGYIWIGSYGGLIRYDGTQFRNYSVDRTIESSSVRALYEDSKGRLWIGTNDDGIVVMENDTFTKIALPSDRSFLCIRDFAEGADGTVYVASNSGLAKVENGTIIPYDSDLLQGNTIYSVAVDSFGRIWGAANNGECVVLENGKAPVLLPSDTFFQDADVYSIDSDKGGRIIIGSSSNLIGVVSFSDDILTKNSFDISYYNTGSIIVHNAVSVGKSGEILASGNNGLAVISADGNVTEFGEDKNAASVNAAIVDYENDIWLASSAYGIIKYSLGCMDSPNHRAGLDGIAINAIAFQNNHWYIGTDTGLIICDRNWNRVENNLTEMFTNVRVRCIQEDLQGNVWIASYSDFAVVCYDTASKAIQQFNTANGLTNDKARVITLLSDGRIAVGTQGGVDLFENGQLVQSYGHEDGLENPTILCIAEDKNGRLVVGSDGDGIYVIDNNTVTNYGFDQGLAEGVVLRLLYDRENDGWFISAGSNLYYWQNNSFWRITNFTKDAGSVFEFYDKDGKLWLLQNNGILTVDKQTLLSGEQTEVIRHDFAHGLTGSLNANTWNYVDEEGTLYIATRNGISTFRFQNISGGLPKIIINSANSDGQMFEHPQHLHVEGNTNRITIDFSALSFSNTSDLRIAYRLEGFDEDAVITDTKSGNVSYTNLPGGDYTFRVWVYNPANPEVTAEQTLSITKKLQLHEQTWFRILVIVVIALLASVVVVMIAGIRMRRIKRRQQEYKNIVDQSLRTFAKIIDAKDHYTQGHSARVAIYSKELARRLSMTPEEQERIYYIALLHDIGKIGVPDNILNKPGKLTPEEMKIIQSHVKVGGEILKDFTAINGIADGASYHHERCDGNGYCMGLSKEQIPLVARIIGVADSYDAMSSDRCYRKALSVDVIVRELTDHSGSQFDENIIPHMLDMIHENFAPVKTEIE
nr:HD domain-containing protein [Lachnospiraceae bacterium]